MVSVGNLLKLAIIIFLGDGKKEEEEGEEGEEEGEGEEGEKKEEKDDGTPEDEVPVGQECFGMKVIISGTKKDLTMSQDEVAELITTHGGEVVDSVDEATFMISTKAELKKAKLTKKVQSAIDSIPIFSIDFLNNLVERKEEVRKERSEYVGERLSFFFFFFYN